MVVLWSWEKMKENEERFEVDIACVGRLPIRK